MLTVSLPLKTVSTTNMREHWGRRASRVEAQRKAVKQVVAGVPSPRGRVQIRLVRIAPAHLQCDGHDNLTSSLKAVCDEVATWLGRDDADPSLAWSYLQEVGPYAVRIEVEPAVDPDVTGTVLCGGRHAP